MLLRLIRAPIQGLTKEAVKRALRDDYLTFRRDLSASDGWSALRQAGPISGCPSARSGSARTQRHPGCPLVRAVTRLYAAAVDTSNTGAPMAASGGTKAVVTALLANLGIAVTKFLAWILTGSSSMLAEGVHSLADSSNQVLLLIGGRRAQRQPSPTHQFGYGRVRYVYAFIVSIVLFTLGGCFALYEAWHKWSDPHGIEAWHWVPPLVLGLAILMEAFALRTAVKEANRVRGRLPWLRYIRKTRSPELPVILLEDTGALVGQIGRAHV